LLGSVSDSAKSCTNSDSIAAQPAEPWDIKKDVQKLETNAYGLINFSKNSTTKPSKTAGGMYRGELMGLPRWRC